MMDGGESGGGGQNEAYRIVKHLNTLHAPLLSKSYP
jgi:hypothetical protein